MTCTCQLCGQPLFGGMSTIMLDPGGTPEEHQKSQALADIADFDLLAARVAQHINEHHKRREAQEMSAVMFLAGKVYAMTYGESSTEPNFKKLRVAWRKAIMAQLFESRDDDQGADEAPAAGDSAAPAGEASNEKKSVRNNSI